MGVTVPPGSSSSSTRAVADSFGARLVGIASVEVDDEGIVVGDVSGDSPSAFFDRIALPMNEILKGVALPSRVQDALDIVGVFAVEDNRRCGRRNGAGGVRVGSVLLEEGNVEDGMDLHGRREVELVGHLAHLVEDLERTHLLGV